MKGQKCENCIHWRQGDPADKIKNKGLCSYSEISTVLPFWMNDSYQATISWQGTNCATWTHNGKPLEVKGAAL